MKELRAEHAKQTAQQTQSLCDMLQKGIVDVITAQLTPVWIELMALQICTIEVDALEVRMAQAKARRSELEEKVLKIEEKEDNHIAYLEAWLENLSLAKEDKKVDDESKGKGAKVWKELGHESPQLTMPTLTPAVPSTSQQADTADSVASMARKHQGPSTSAGVDQWSMVGLERDDKIEEKDKQRHGKGEDKVKLSPRRVVQPGAASSTGFIRVPPPLSLVAWSFLEDSFLRNDGM